MSSEIWKVPSIDFSKGRDNEFTLRLKKMLSKWAKYANSYYKDWDVRPDCGHFFGGSYWYATDTSNTALVFALIASIPGYDENLTGISKDELISRAIKGIRYLGFTHDVGPDDCVRAKGPNPHASETKWGGKNDDFFKASQQGVSLSDFGLAAWLLWDKLDDETKLLVQNAVIWYADKWSADIMENYSRGWSVNEPKTGTYNNTQTEENGWTSLGVSVAAAMFSSHPKASNWEQAAAVWAANTCTTYLDRYINDPFFPYNRVMSVTTHPDFTTENHGFVHPTYMGSGIALRGKAALLHFICGKTPSPVFFYHWEDVYDKTLKLWCDYDGIPVPIQGQDWWYNHQPAMQLIHAFMSVFKNSSDAASLERITLGSLEKIQESNGNGCLYEKNGEDCRITEFQTAQDMERGAAVALCESLLLHYFGGTGAQPLSKAELDKKLEGVYYYPYGSSVVHRLANSFSVFSWRSCAIGLTMPEKGMWTITPYTSSYVGTIEVESSKGFKALTNEHMVRYVNNEKVLPKEEGFGATASIERGGGCLIQDVSFISLPNGNTVYTERIKAVSDCVIKSLKTGQIGIRNEKYSSIPEVAKGYRTIYAFASDPQVFKGYYGKDPDLSYKWNNLSYINIDNEIGYVLFNSEETEYFNKHQYSKWKGVEDILTLNFKDEKTTLQKDDRLSPFAVVSSPNLDLSGTADLAGNTRMFRTECPNTIAIESNMFMTFVNYNYSDITIKASLDLNENYAYIYSGISKIKDGSFEWTKNAEKREAGYFKAAYKLTWDGNIDIEAILGDGNLLILKNCSEDAALIKINDLTTDSEYEVEIEGSSFISSNG